MPRRKHKKYTKPKKMYDAALIKEENDLIKKYGLKSRREIWRANFAIERIRNIAKDITTASEEEKAEFLERQMKKGFNAGSIADILALGKEDWLKRRLQSIIVQKGFAKTHKQARQMITHKKVALNGKIIDAPSHLTTLEEEQNIDVKIEIPKKNAVSEEEKELLNKMKINNEVKKETEQNTEEAK